MDFSDPSLCFRTAHQNLSSPGGLSPSVSSHEKGSRRLSCGDSPSLSECSSGSDVPSQNFKAPSFPLEAQPCESQPGLNKVCPDPPSSSNPPVTLEVSWSIDPLVEKGSKPSKTLLSSLLTT
jgi:hypothetical protein